MPRQRVNDHTTEDLYVQVSWRRQDEIPESTAPGHVQIATINDRTDALVLQLLDEAVALLGQNDKDLQLDRWMAWIDKQARVRDELTGWYASLDAAAVGELTKTLHKAKRQAFPKADE